MAHPHPTVPYYRIVTTNHYQIYFFNILNIDGEFHTRTIVRLTILVVVYGSTLVRQTLQIIVLRVTLAVIRRRIVIGEFCHHLQVVEIDIKLSLLQDR